MTDTKTHFDDKLTITGPSEVMGDWWVLERESHDGRDWIEPTGPNSGGLRCSSRLDPSADVEGPAEQWLSIAEALENGQDAFFKRCAVRWKDGLASITSPRNSSRDAWVTQATARHLASEIRRKLKGTTP